MSMLSLPTLSTLLAGLATVSPADERPVTGLASDSRRLQPGELFIALRGIRQHGLHFVAAAERAGAVAIVWEPPCTEIPDSRLPLLAVPELSRKLGVIAARFYNQPGQHMTLIGITGTDGKTSPCHYLAQALSQPERPCGVLGTLGYGVQAELMPTQLTTPDALTLWQWLAGLRDRGVQHAVMEVSSHALAQGRADGLEFSVAVLTNLGRDHLDYHIDTSAYAAAKQRLFTELQPRQSVLNLDDHFGRELAERSGRQCIGYSQAAVPPMLSERWVWGHELQLLPDGLRLRIRSPEGGGELNSPLLGRFNVSNLLAALATLLALGWPLEQALARLAQVKAPPGRMQRLGGDGRPLAVIDYAHTPQALEQVLMALRDHGHHPIHCVLGCGGDRDPGKRPLMGLIAERWADQVTVTDDNPRWENASAITRQIIAAMQGNKHRGINDRAQAIRAALRQACAGDTVLIAGKGHEDYQIVGDQRFEFSDYEVAAAALREWWSC